MTDKHNEYICGECGKPYILTKEERALIKDGWYLLRYVCPNCVREALKEVNKEMKE